MTEKSRAERYKEPSQLADSLKYYREVLEEDYAEKASDAYLEALHQLVVVVEQAGVTDQQAALDLVLRILPIEYDGRQDPDEWRAQLRATPLELCNSGYLLWHEIDLYTLCELFSLVDSERHDHTVEGNRLCISGGNCPMKTLQEAAKLQLWIVAAERAGVETGDEETERQLWERERFIFQALVAKRAFSPLELKAVEGKIQNDLFHLHDPMAYEA